MNKKFLFCVLGNLLLPIISVAQAQQPAKLPAIGYLDAPTFSANADRLVAFQQGLRELGYAEGKNIVIEQRFADGKLDRLPALAAELVRLKVDIIVSGGTNVTRAAREATSSIPIVMTNDTDPVASGVVASLARPGGNITGLSVFGPELSGKRLEILREVVPQLARVAAIGTRTDPGYAVVTKEVNLAAKALKLQVQYFDVLGSKDIESAFRAAVKGRAQAVLTLGGAILNSYRSQIAELAVSNQLPTIYNLRQYADAGGLMAYGVNLNELSRRAATYVDKILKGAKSGEIPVEQPTKFEFIVNLKAAKQINLTIPPNVLARADRVMR